MGQGQMSESGGILVDNISKSMWKEFLKTMWKGKWIHLVQTDLEQSSAHIWDIWKMNRNILASRLFSSSVTACQSMYKCENSTTISFTELVWAQDSVSYHRNICADPRISGSSGNCRENFVQLARCLGGAANISQLLAGTPCWMIRPWEIIALVSRASFWKLFTALVGWALF